MATYSRKKLITHDGSFHSDDLFACATLCLYLENKGVEPEIIRSREEEIINTGDYVFDVGGVYDPDNNRFDHHQKDAPAPRANGIPYASFGLVWKYFGLELSDGKQEVWEMIDRKMACPIDAIDNGVDIVEPKFENIFPYSGDQPFLVFSPTWKERDENINEVFIEQVAKAKEVLKREIKVALDDREAMDILRKDYEEAQDKRIIITDYSFPRYLYQSFLSVLLEPVYLVYPGVYGNNWKVEAIRKDLETYESRKSLPEAWRGFMNGDPKLAEVTGVEDALFSHRNGFLITAKTREGALELARKALEF